MAEGSAVSGPQAPGALRGRVVGEEWRCDGRLSAGMGRGGDPGPFRTPLCPHGGWSGLIQQLGLYREGAVGVSVHKELPGPVGMTHPR